MGDWLWTHWMRHKIICRCTLLSHTLPFLFLPAYQQTQTPHLPPQFIKHFCARSIDYYNSLASPHLPSESCTGTAWHYTWNFSSTAQLAILYLFILYTAKALPPLASSITFAHHPQCIRKTFSAFFAYWRVFLHNNARHTRPPSWCELQDVHRIIGISTKISYYFYQLLWLLVTGRISIS